MTAIRAVIALATAGLAPDLTILLDLEPRQGLRRKVLAQRNRLDDEALAFHKRVRAAYLDLAAQKLARWLVLDAVQDEATLTAHIVAAVDERLQGTMRNSAPVRHLCAMALHRGWQARLDAVPVCLWRVIPR